MTDQHTAAEVGAQRPGRPANPCGHWDGPERRYCGATDGVRRYVIGHRCPLHTPAALQGKPEPPEGPGWPAHAWTTPSPQSASALIDNRAVASGKRRSSPHVYRATQAAVADEKEVNR
ncbi:hypothetical protein ACFOSC_26650 [Streptantibioticus rubrisoli]|uniref:Uncharacterized protein n=1 Tax=Streptantibioticus rubrisoli TaxID=1387313 RepID=A0ABT1PHR6_9ACTN|nr:hypothetical protein [Streptantibioticus rubrisoli]MCQ4043845.1 hypothetical protein [Streptantibioticus rubrisoli]